MTTPVTAIEGTWEEIVTHAPELAGRRVRVVVLPGGGGAPLCVSARLARLRELDRLTAGIHPKPDVRDWLREDRSGDMYGYEPAE